MPRSKPREEPLPTWEPFRFTDEQRRDLLKLLGFAEPESWEDYFDRSNVLREVEILLGHAPFTIALVDEYPTEANLRDRLASLTRRQEFAYAYQQTR